MKITPRPAICEDGYNFSMFDLALYGQAFKCNKTELRDAPRAAILNMRDAIRQRRRIPDSRNLTTEDGLT